MSGIPEAQDSLTLENLEDLRCTTESHNINLDERNRVNISRKNKFTRIKYPLEMTKEHLFFKKRNLAHHNNKKPTFKNSKAMTTQKTRNVEDNNESISKSDHIPKRKRKGKSETTSTIQKRGRRKGHLPPVNKGMSYRKQLMKRRSNRSYRTERDIHPYSKENPKRILETISEGDESISSISSDLTNSKSKPIKNMENRSKDNESICNTSINMKFHTSQVTSDSEELPELISVSESEETTDGETSAGEENPDHSEKSHINTSKTTNVTLSHTTMAVSSNRRNRKRKASKPCYSETRRYRLLRVYMKVLDRNGNIRRTQVALDTQSNISYARRHLGTDRKWDPRESRVVSGVGGTANTSSTPLLTRIIKKGKVVHLKTRTPPNTILQRRGGPEILLSANHCALLNIDINKTLRTLTHQDVQYLDEEKKEATEATCLISEKLMSRYLEKTGGSDKEPNQCSIKDVVIAEDFTPEQVQRVKTICQKYKDVFASSPDDIPPPMKEAKPHVFKMKEGIKPIYCKRPNWGPAQRKYLEQWTRKAIAQGLMEPAPRSQWASRPVLVGKYRGQTAKGDVPDGIRTCVDFTAVNEFIVRQPPQYTDPFQEIRRASGHKRYFEADGQKQFNSILLDPASRDITTTWTPLGLMRWKRLIMGTKDASGRAQQEYSKSMSKHLNEEEKNHLANFQDDFLGFHNEIIGLLRVFEGFLRMCKRAGITLNPAKIRVGIKKCKFYGFTLSEKGMEPSEKNLDPVEKMTIPKNRSEVRSVMGVFNQFRHFFERFDRLVCPIQRLLRKNEPFIWSKEANQGFEHIKKTLLSGELYLAAQDLTTPLILETDGSDDGWGAILLQIIKGERRIICMWSKQWKTLHMRRSPPYYKETKAWMNGLENTRIYADYSPFPVQCITDHIPLTYIKNTSGKGPVSQFVLDNLSSLDYTITYREGRKLVEADAVSRFPCLGPRELAPDGVKEAFNILLSTLPTNWNLKKLVWVNAQKETEIIQHMVRQWMTLLPKVTPSRKVPYTETPTKERITKIDYGVGIWVPTADKAQDIVNTAMNKKSPFACLLPSCLVNLLPQTEENKEMMSQSIKLVLLQPELTWILHAIPSVTRHEVYPIISQPEVFSGLTDFRGIVRGHPNWNLKDWVPEQRKMVDKNRKIYSPDKIHYRKSDGFILYKPKMEVTLALVPEKYRTELILWQHHHLCHAGQAKVYNALQAH